MRLGQLARQLNVTASDIVRFLESKDVSVNEHPNSKFPEEFEELVNLHFGGTKKPIFSEIQDLEEAKPIEPKKRKKVKKEILEIVESNQEEIQEPQTKEPVIVENSSNNKLEEDTIEVIKAPKIELPGLKVLGKIDLPEPKEKVIEPSDIVLSEEPKSKKKELSKSGKRVLSTEEREAKRVKLKEERRKKEEWEAHKKKLREERQRKEARAAHYEKTVKQKVVVAPKKNKPKKASSEEELDNRPIPKTWLGKFWRWLNT